MDTPKTGNIEATRQGEDKPKKTNNIENKKDPTKNRWWTQVFVKDKQYLSIRRLLYSQDMLDTTLQHNLFKEKVSYLNKNHSVIQALIVYML